MWPRKCLNSALYRLPIASPPSARRASSTAISKTWTMRDRKYWVHCPARLPPTSTCSGPMRPEILTAMQPPSAARWPRASRKRNRCMFDCSKEMKNFHGDKVTLSTDMRNEMRERRNNGRTRLDKGLERDGHKTPAYFAQGSYAMHTMVQDDAKEFDIDDGAYFSLAALTNADGIELTTTQAKERVRDAIRQDQRLKEPADIHDNCVRQVYPAGYHIDIPVYRIKTSKDASNNTIETYELATKDA